MEGPAPLLVVLSGVSGSGKSSVARELARRCGFCYLEGDDFHSREARERMGQGKPLDDTWRAPWIESIRNHLRCIAEERQDCVLAFSGLKKRYRDALRGNGFRVLFLLLTAERDVIRARLERRRGHFMPPALLDSQLDALELPREEPDVLLIDATPPLEEVVSRAVRAVPACAPCPGGLASRL